MVSAQGDILAARMMVGNGTAQTYYHNKSSSVHYKNSSLPLVYTGEVAVIEETYTSDSLRGSKGNPETLGVGALQSNSLIQECSGSQQIKWKSGAKT